MITLSLPLIVPGTEHPAGWFVDAVQTPARPDTARRFPLAPLMAAAGIETMVELGRVFPMNGTTYRRILDDGLSELQADRWAVRLRLVPWLVWPEWFDLAFVDCASSDCGERFVPRDLKGQQRYCSATCRNRERARRYRATDAGAEAARRARRVYYWSDPKVRAHESKVKREQRAAERRAAA